MHLHTIRRTTVAAVATALVATGMAAAAPSRGRAEPAAPSPAVQAVLDWKLTAAQTVFGAGTPPPVGALYLGFTSLAVHGAAHESLKRRASSEVAAVAQAAHDVLVEYFPAATTNLDNALAASLLEVPDGPAEAKGIRVGRRAAAEMIESRVGDGRGDTSIVYQKPTLPGFWQPAPGSAFAFPWLGFVKPLVIDTPVELDGPAALTSAEYAADFDEVKRVGRADAPLSDRSAEETAIARFFNAGNVRMYAEALCRLLQAEPLGLRDTVDLFAVADAAVADTFIQTWRLKYDLGFWRPFQAIPGAADDGNDATAPDATWTPLVNPNPSYPDYPSGHGSATAPLMEAARLVLGNDTALRLELPNGTWRGYETVSALEHDALHARIWGGLHARDTMEDTYVLGHATAQAVWAELR